MSTFVVESELDVLSSDDLVAAIGGQSADGKVNLTCPAGTAPNYTRVSGNFQLTVPGGFTVPVAGGAYDRFSCDPLPGSPTPTPSLSPTALRPGGDR
jgi:hypothetical protein